MPVLAEDPHGRGGRLQKQMMDGLANTTTTHKIHSVSQQSIPVCMMYHRTKPALARNSEDSRDGNRDTNAPEFDRRQSTKQLSILSSPSASQPRTPRNHPTTIIPDPDRSPSHPQPTPSPTSCPPRCTPEICITREGGDRRAATPERSDEICDNNLYL